MLPEAQNEVIITDRPKESVCTSALFSSFWPILGMIIIGCSFGVLFCFLCGGKKIVFLFLSAEKRMLLFLLVTKHLNYSVDLNIVFNRAFICVTAHPENLSRLVS